VIRDSPWNPTQKLSVFKVYL